MSAWSEFIGQFKTIDEAMIDDLDVALAALLRGVFVLNKEKFRIEFQRVSPGGGGDPVLAWIDLGSLISSKDPQSEFEEWVCHLLEVKRRGCS